MVVTRELLGETGVLLLNEYNTEFQFYKIKELWGWVVMDAQ